MFYTVYILYSETAEKHYCGCTSLSIPDRLTRHNSIHRGFTGHMLTGHAYGLEAYRASPKHSGWTSRSSLVGFHAFWTSSPVSASRQRSGLPVVDFGYQFVLRSSVSSLSHATGNLMMKVDPPPFSLITVNSPPWAFTIS